MSILPIAGSPVVDLYVSYHPLVLEMPWHRAEGIEHGGNNGNDKFRHPLRLKGFVHEECLSVPYLSSVVPPDGTEDGCLMLPLDRAVRTHMVTKPTGRAEIWDNDSLSVIPTVDGRAPQDLDARGSASVQADTLICFHF